MLRRTLMSLSLALALGAVSVPLKAVQSLMLSQGEQARVERNGRTYADNNGLRKNSSAIVSILKAPFKAIGRLFGRGKHDNKLHRLSEKDVKGFETAQVTRINDATSEAAPAPPDRDLSPPEHLERGRLLLNEGNLNEAIEELSLAISLDAELADAHNLLGVAYDRKGLPERARKSFETALKIDKKNPQFINNLGYLLYGNHDYRGAADRFKEAARLAPDDARILNNLGLAQTQLGKFDEAYKSFARAGGELNGRLNVANRLELAGRSEEAQKQYQAARLKAEADQRADPNTQVITVVAEIKDGRVTYAWVPNHRSGKETYEASALRIARQRRYPLGKNGREFMRYEENSLKVIERMRALGL